MSIGHMAQEYGITRQAVYDREQKAFQTIRAGSYATCDLWNVLQGGHKGGV